MITFKHVTTGVVTEVPTPEEKTVGLDLDDRDRTYRRQTQLIARMDASSKWQRVAAHATPPRTPVTDPPDAPVVVTVDQDHSTPPASTPTATQPDGPKFTRVTVKK